MAESIAGVISYSNAFPLVNEGFNKKDRELAGI
jgi:hypothetical protein